MKVKDNIKSGIQIFFEWFAKLSALNFCFIIGTIMGVGLFGLGPSIRAMNYYIKKTFEKDELKVIPTFWKIYSHYFLSSFLISLIYIVPLGLLGFSIYISYFYTTDNYVKLISLVSALILFIYFFIGFNFVYYFLNEFEISFASAIKYSFTIPWARFGYMLLIVILNLLLFILLALFDVIVLILTFSISAFIIEYFARKIFNQNVRLKIQNHLDIKKKEEETIIKELMEEDLKKLNDKKND